MTSRPLIALAVVGFWACDSHDHAPPANAALTDVLYGAGANDEALQALLDAAPVADAAKAPAVAVPAANAQAPRTPALKFSWSATSAWSAPPVQSPWLRRLRQFLDPLPGAYAHGETLNGRAYFLVVAAADDPKLVRVFTRDTVYTPDAGVWGRIIAAKGPLTVTVTAAIFESSRVAPGGGPWQSATVAFSVAP